jgi:hypothetical protein
LVPEGADRGYKSGYKTWRIDGHFRYLVNNKNVIFEKIYSLGGVEARGGWRSKLVHFVAGRSGGLAPALARR